MLSFGLIALALVATARLAEKARYADAAQVRVKLASGRWAGMVRESDYYLQLGGMLAIWLEIALAFIVGKQLPVWLAVPLVAIFVAGRFRALQEYGHSALHRGFGENKRRQWRTADWLGNYHTFKPNSQVRYRGHVVEHHPNAATERDPNVTRLRALGFEPGMSAQQLREFLWHPLTLRGVSETMALFQAALGSRREALLRFTLLFGVLAVLTTSFGAWAELSWLIGLCLVYPLFSWWSLLAEHRWFASSGSADDQLAELIAVTPRTVYSGLPGFLVRTFVSPGTDSLHRAHHVYPRLHWRYLPAADEHLRSVCGDYEEHTVTSLFAKDGSMLADLRMRMVLRGTWGRDGGIQS